MTPAALPQPIETLAVSSPVEAIMRRLESLGPGQRLALTVPAPSAEPEALFDAATAIGLGEPNTTASIGQPVTDDHGLVWRPPEGPAFAGLGVAVELRLHGHERFADLRQRAGEFFDALETDALEGAEALVPRAFGGFAFDVGAADAAPWQAFGDGCFTLPRWLYRRHEDSADLTLTVAASELRQTPPDHWAKLTHSLLTALRELAERSTFTGTRPVELPRLIEDPAADNAWASMVEDIRRAIRRGDVEKIVAARRFTVELAASRPLARVIERLEQRRRSTAFAFARPGATFLGLTPERLISKRGLEFRTEALAGSIESGAEHAAELLGSGKDRLEQQLVVDAILRRLAPLAKKLEAAARPNVRELPEVLHLHTPIHGELHAPRHLLELVELLHPTPAVGGVPTADAMAWIRANEDDARGWYAAPIGWFDAAGDGEIFVALRSCLLSPGRAELYAGAGIVSDSDPRRELAEVRLKLRTLMHALAA